MEFERAIFRVYERCVEGFRDDESDMASKSCRMFEIFAFSSGIFFALILGLLHMEYVGSSGCLPQVMNDLGKLI